MMEPELPPNKACPRCGAENIASADECVECHRSLGRVAQEVLYIGPAGKPHGMAPFHPQRPVFWRVVFRLLGILAVTFLAMMLSSGQPHAAPMVGFFTLAILGGLSLATSLRREALGRALPPLGEGGGVLDVLDVILRGMGLILGALVTLGLSLFVFLLIACNACR